MMMRCFFRQEKDAIAHAVDDGLLLRLFRRHIPEGTVALAPLYLDLTNTVLRLCKAVLADPAAKEFAAEVSPLQVIADKIRALRRPADISQVM